MKDMERIYDAGGLAYETDGKTAWCLNCAERLDIRIPEGVIPHDNPNDCEHYRRIGAIWNNFLLRATGRLS